MKKENNLTSVDWQITDKNKQQLSIAEAKFIFSQAEKQLQQTINGSSLIVTRTTVLLTIVVAILSSLIGYLITRYNINLIDKQFIIATIVFIYLFILTIYLSQNIKGHDYKDIGSEPKTLLHDYFFNKYPIAERREVEYYISEIEDYQIRIEEGKRLNTQRWNSFHFAMKAIIYLPILILVISVIAYLIQTFIFCG